MICFFASEVGAAIGMNKHKSPAEVLETMWKRHAGGTSYHEAQQRLQRSTVCGSIEDRVAAVILSDPALQQIQQQCETDFQTQALSTVLSKVKKRIDQTVEQPDWTVTPDQIIKCLRQQFTRAYGQREEKHSLDHIASESQAPVTESNQQFYKKVLGTSTAGTRYAVGGRIDGLVNNHLIEVKNRRSQIPDVIPTYDLVQLHCYMYLLDKPQATLIEHVKQKNQIVKSRETIVSWDPVFWQQIVQRMSLFTDVFHHLLQNPHAQERLLSAQNEDDKQQEYFLLASAPVQIISTGQTQPHVLSSPSTVLLSRSTADTRNSSS